MQQSLTQPASPELRDALDRYVGAVGEDRAVATLGVSRNALIRAMSGRPIRRGTALALAFGVGDALATSSAPDLLTTDDVIRARGEGRPLGAAADERARSLTSPPTHKETP